MEHLFLLGLIIVVLAILASERVRPELVGMGVVVVLIVSGTVDVETGLSGFSNPAVITVIAMFILSAGLVRTGVADTMGAFLIRFGGGGPVRLTLSVMLVVGVLSAFMNNIGATAVLVSAIFAVARRVGYPASKLLIPLSFGSLFGGLTTMIGTPPNLLVSQALADAGFTPFSMFDFLPTGLIVVAVGATFMALVGRHLLPVTRSTHQPGATTRSDYVTEVTLSPRSPLAGKSVAELDQQPGGSGFNVLGIIRRAGGVPKGLAPRADAVLEAHDSLVVEADVEELLSRRPSAGTNGTGDDRLVEAAVAPNSRLVDQSIVDTDLERQYGITVLGLRRHHKTVHGSPKDTPLEFGDVLLLQGPPKALEALNASHDFLVVKDLDHEPHRRERAPVAVLIMAVVATTAATGLLHISVAGLLGVIAMALTGCVRPEEMFRKVDWRLIFLIATLIPLGAAMDHDHLGTGPLIAGYVGEWGEVLGPRFAMVVLMGVTMLLTAILHNAAVVVLIAPVAVSVAVGMGLAPHPFMMAVAIAASCALLTPVGHQANLLAYGMGGYRFADFAKVGAPLTLLILVVATVAVPWIWPFTPIAQ